MIPRNGDINWNTRWKCANDGRYIKDIWSDGAEKEYHSVGGRALEVQSSFQEFSIHVNFDSRELDRIEDAE